jgi:hypothetical protein
LRGSAVGTLLPFLLGAARAGLGLIIRRLRGLRVSDYVAGNEQQGSEQSDVEIFGAFHFGFYPSVCGG